MKTWKKILIVFVGGGACWALSYCSSIWPTYAIILSSLSATSAAAVGLLTGFIAPAK
jgi:hypothetical protein